MNRIHPLRDRVVVLDPGHGFGVTGAIGKGGTVEADVNLKVVHRLRKLLTDAGASVFITTEHMVEESLDTRVRLSKEFDADFFISIHHNATAPPDPTRNRIEVYYPWNGTVDAENLAYFIGNSLARFSGLPFIPPLPARYRVLTGNVPISVLVEPAYISNRKMEQLLRDDTYIRGEAKAIFDGLIAFLTSPKPNISQFRFSVRRLHLQFRVRASSIQKQQFYWHLSVGNKKIYSGIDKVGKTVSLDLSSLPNGNYHARLEVTIPNGRTAEQQIPITIKRTPKGIRIESLREYSGLTMVTLCVVDRLNQPTSSELKVSPNPLFIKRKSDNKYVIIFDEGGKYWFSSGRVSKTLTVKVKPGRWLRVVNRKHKPIEDAIILIDGRVDKMNRSLRGGFLPIPEEFDDAVIISKGYKDLRVQHPIACKTVILDAKNEGLLGRRVVVTVESRSQNLLILAYLLKDFLEEKGVSTTVLEPEDITMDEVSKLRRIEGYVPDIVFIFTTNFRWREGFYYYYRDRASKELALSLAEGIREFSPAVTAAEGATYLLIQAKPTRVLVNLFVIEVHYVRKIGQVLTSYLLSS